eukprot:gene5672-18775_t
MNRMVQEIQAFQHQFPPTGAASFLDGYPGFLRTGGFDVYWQRSQQLLQELSGADAESGSQRSADPFAAGGAGAAAKRPAPPADD